MNGVMKNFKTLKAMKNVKTILFGLAVLSMAACTQEKLETPNTDNQELVEVTIEAGIDNGVDSKVVFGEPEGKKVKMNWNPSGEAFSLVLGASGSPYTFNQVSGNSFVGKLPETVSSATAYTIAYYPVLPTTVTTMYANNNYLIDLSNQTGKLDDSKTYMYYKIPLTPNNFLKEVVKPAISFHSIVAVLKINLDFKEKIKGSATVSVSAEDLINKDSFKFHTDQYTGVNKSVGASVNFSESVEVVDGKATVYLYMIPDKVTDLEVSATVNAQIYKGTIKNYTGNNGNGFKAGVLYNTNVEMSVPGAAEKVEYAVGATTGGYSYEGFTMTITNSTKNYSKTASFDATGNAVIGSEAWANFEVGDEINVCIPNVVKFFHKVTTADIANKCFVLPDKNNGSTLLAEPTIAGKPYVNDWIVALYMGVDAANGNALYWATGNLIAVKTNDGAPSEMSFFIADATITTQESNTTANPYRIFGTETEDRFADSSNGTMTDMFESADPSGLRGINNNEHTLKWSSDQWDYSGTKNDICTEQLGQNWRLPVYNGGYEAETPSEMQNLRKKTNEKAVNNTYTYTYTNERGIVNTLVLPWCGGRTGSTQAKRALYMSGTISNNAEQIYILDSQTYWCDTRRGNTKYLVAVRPVTE